MFSSSVTWLPATGMEKADTKFIQGCGFSQKRAKIQEQKVEGIVRKSGNDEPWNPNQIELGSWIGALTGIGTWMGKGEG